MKAEDIITKLRAFINDDEIHEVFPKQVVRTEWVNKRESK